MKKLGMVYDDFPAMRIWKGALEDDKLVYLLVSDKKLKYGKKSSKIAYIGTTKRGIRRIATSVSSRAQELFDHSNASKFDVHVVTCNPRQRIRSWEVLERAMLLGFHQLYGNWPKLNKKGVSEKKGKAALEYFKKEDIHFIIKELG